MTEEQSQLIANFRYGVIAPVVVQPLERGEQARMLREMAKREYKIPFSAATKIHERTLERWLSVYRKGGLEALKPKQRADSGSSRTVPEGALEKAKALRVEVPQRSVPQIITMLEMAGEVEKGQLKESTLRRQLGPVEKTSSRRPKVHRRFEAPHRNDIWQGDSHHTLYLPDPENKGKNRQVYLLAFIDDYSRYVVHGQYYFEERRPKLEDCLKKAILKFGVCSRLYCDNGAIYSGPHLQRISGELGFQLIHSRPGMPQGRGKIEKLFQYVDRSFKPEAYALIASGRLSTLDELNDYFWAWLEIYHRTRSEAGGSVQAALQRVRHSPDPLHIQGDSEGDQQPVRRMSLRCDRPGRSTGGTWPTFSERSWITSSCRGNSKPSRGSRKGGLFLSTGVGQTDTYSERSVSAMQFGWFADKQREPQHHLPGSSSRMGR